MSNKNVNNCKWKTFLDIFGQLHTQEYKATKKEDDETLVKWREVKGRPNKINELILKTKADLKEGRDDI